MEFKRLLAWKAHFRLKDFKSSPTLESFLNLDFQQFQKQPWYEKSSNTPPPLPHALESAFVPQYLAFPAISKTLKQRNLSTKEISAVVDGLKIVRDGNFFKWKDNVYNQISGCALGDPDSCSYTDITMADLLDRMVPACQETTLLIWTLFSKYIVTMV